MLLDPHRIELRYYGRLETHQYESVYAGESRSTGPAGLYVHPEDGKKLIVALEESGLARPAQLAATICHELGHVHLLADARIDRNTPDSEPLTDLVTVYFGVGIFAANGVFQFNQWQSHSHQGWSASRLGYLSEQMFGYALACYCWYRGELKPDWDRHLRSNIHYYFDDSLHFLNATQDSNVKFNGIQGLSGK